MDLSPVFNHQNFLQIRTESPIGCPHRETSTMSKHSFLAAIFTLSHSQFLSSLRQIAWSVAKLNEQQFYHTSYRNTRIGLLTQKGRI